MQRLSRLVALEMVLSTSSLLVSREADDTKGLTPWCSKIQQMRLGQNPEDNGPASLFAAALDRYNRSTADRILSLAEDLCIVNSESTCAKHGKNGFPKNAKLNFPFLTAALCDVSHEIVAKSVMQITDKMIRSGAKMTAYGQSIDPTSDFPTSAALLSSLFGLMGEMHIHPVSQCIRSPFCSGEFGDFFWQQPWKELHGDWQFDAEGKFCHATMSYLWSHPRQDGTDFPAVYAWRDDIDAYVRACRAEFPRMSAEEREILGPFHKSGRIPMDVLLPVEHDEARRIETRDRARRLGAAPGREEKMTYEELAETLMATASAVHDYPGVLTDEDFYKSLQYWSKFDLRKAKRIPGEWDEVARAIRNDEVATFDARALFPADIFNITLDEMAEGEGPSSERISLWCEFTSSTSLTRYTNIMNKTRAGIPVKDSQRAYVNTKRMPKFFERLPDVAEKLQLKPHVTRTESFLWMGKVMPNLHWFSTDRAPGALHFDEESNFYIQVTGVTQYVVIPLNFTEVSFGATRHPGYPTFQELEQDPYFRNVTLHLITLKPGDGLTFPGMAYHSVHPLVHDRVALNFFFVPGWRQMEHTPMNWYSKEADRSLKRLALRQLWARSFARAWDDEGRGMFAMGEKLEYL